MLQGKLILHSIGQRRWFCISLFAKTKKFTFGVNAGTHPLSRPVPDHRYEHGLCEHRTVSSRSWTEIKHPCVTDEWCDHCVPARAPLDLEYSWMMLVGGWEIKWVWKWLPPASHLQRAGCLASPCPLCISSHMPSGYRALAAFSRKLCKHKALRVSSWKALSSLGSSAEERVS